MFLLFTFRSFAYADGHMLLRCVYPYEAAVFGSASLIESLPSICQSDRKSAMTQHQKEYFPVFCRSPADLKEIFSCLGRNLGKVLLTIDMGVSSFLDQQKLSEWVALQNHIEKTVGESQCDMYVGPLSESKEFKQCSMIDLTDKYCLAYAKIDNIPLIAIDVANNACHQNGSSFFRRPEIYIQKQIMSMKQNNAGCGYSDRLIECISVMKHLRVLDQTLNTQGNSYLMQGLHGMYCFTHTPQKENVLYLL